MLTLLLAQCAVAQGGIVQMNALADAMATP
jgi:hypothetical protein